MFFQYGIDSRETQPAEAESQYWTQQLETYLEPVSQRLDAYLDRRVVGNLTAAVAGIVTARAPVTTSELGSAILGPAHAEAGTQRLQRALHHEGWQGDLIEEVLWEQAELSLQQMERRGETALCIWDSSVLEKPESQKLEGLGKVRSSRVKRLARSRKGLFNQPGVPVRVPGFDWESLLLVGEEGRPQVVTMTWWEKQEGVPLQQRQQHHRLLSQVARRFGRRVRHVFDRGYAHGPWLALLSRFRVRFVMRWKKGNQLLDASGQERKAWEIARGKRSWGTQAKLLWDTHTRTSRSTRVLALPVRHPAYPGLLWLVVVRQGGGREPWYLLTNEPVETEEQAWDIAFSYVSRWKIEEQFRFEKTELLIESVRLRGWEPRRKLLLLITLAYGFLLAALAPPLFQARAQLLSRWDQRADWRLWTAKLPLYRLRWSLSRLWLSHPPCFACSGWRPYRPLSHLTWPPCSLRWWMTLWHQSGYLF
jgi:hypothetical protein